MPNGDIQFDDKNIVINYCVLSTVNRNLLRIIFNICFFSQTNSSISKIDVIEKNLKKELFSEAYLASSRASAMELLCKNN